MRLRKMRLGASWKHIFRPSNILFTLCRVAWVWQVYPSEPLRMATGFQAQDMKFRIMMDGWAGLGWAMLGQVGSESPSAIFLTVFIRSSDP